MMLAVARENPWRSMNWVNWERGATCTTYVSIRVESGLDDPDNLGHFFGGSSGSHLHPDITCSLETVSASGKWVNFGSDECTEISLVWNQHFISSCFEACGVQRFHLLESSLCKGLVRYPANIEEISLWHCTFFMSCGSQVGQMWVTSRLFCGLVGQMGQQVRPTFNPGFN